MIEINNNKIKKILKARSDNISNKTDTVISSEEDFFFTLARLIGEKEEITDSDIDLLLDISEDVDVKQDYDEDENQNESAYPPFIKNSHNNSSRSKKDLFLDVMIDEEDLVFEAINLGVGSSLERRIMKNLDNQFKRKKIN